MSETHYCRRVVVDIKFDKEDVEGQPVTEWQVDDCIKDFKQRLLYQLGDGLLTCNYPELSVTKTIWIESIGSKWGKDIAPMNPPHIAQTVLVYVKAQATSEHGEYPPFAYFTLEQGLVNKLYSLRSQCAGEIVSISIGLAPDKWWKEEEFDFIYPELRVDRTGFCFSDFPKGTGYGVETLSICFADLEKALLGVGDMETPKLYFGDSLELLVQECEEELKSHY